MARKRRKKQPLLASHQRSWVWGRHLVLEILRTGTWPIVELYIEDAVSDDEAREVSSRAAGLDVPVHTVPAERLLELGHAPDHQGFLAKMGPFPHAHLEDVLAHLGPAPLVVILDGVQDSYNFGAIIRSAEVLGVDAVCIGTHGQCDVNSMVARSSAGAVNRIPIVRVTDLVGLVIDLKARGITVVGTSPGAGVTPSDLDLTGPAALVMGNESTGIRRELLDACDAYVRIPQKGDIQSLNVAAAAAVLFYEAARQRTCQS